MTKTVAAATTKNTAVAAIDRGDSRAMPHMPWPLVQPAPIWVPTPTRNAATIRDAPDA